LQDALEKQEEAYDGALAVQKEHQLENQEKIADLHYKKDQLEELAASLEVDASMVVEAEESLESCKAQEVEATEEWSKLEMEKAQLLEDKTLFEHWEQCEKLPGKTQLKMLHDALARQQFQESILACVPSLFAAGQDRAEFDRIVFEHIMESFTKLVEEKEASIRDAQIVLKVAEEAVVEAKDNLATLTEVEEETRTEKDSWKDAVVDAEIALKDMEAVLESDCQMMLDHQEAVNTARNRLDEFEKTVGIYEDLKLRTELVRSPVRELVEDEEEEIFEETGRGAFKQKLLGAVTGLLGFRKSEKFAEEISHTEEATVETEEVTAEPEVEMEVPVAPEVEEGLVEEVAEVEIPLESEVAETIEALPTEEPPMEENLTSNLPLKRKSVAPSARKSVGAKTPRGGKTPKEMKTPRSGRTARKSVA